MFQGGTILNMTAAPKCDGTLNIAVLAYGSLLSHSGSWLGAKMKELKRCETPFGVEYSGRAKKRRGGAPTLVKCDEGQPVRGGLVVLDLRNTLENVAEVRTQLAAREGARD